MSEQQFSLDAEQIAFREVIRKFAEDKIAPYAADSDHNSAYSWESFKALQQMELTALSYPVEYGGSGASLVTQSVVAEELARVCASTSLMFLTSAFIRPSQYLPPLYYQIQPLGAGSPHLFISLSRSLIIVPTLNAIPL